MIAELAVRHGAALVSPQDAAKLRRLQALREKGIGMGRCARELGVGIATVARGLA